jgi:hypothetical protein
MVGVPRGSEVGENPTLSRNCMDEATHLSQVACREGCDKALEARAVARTVLRRSIPSTERRTL